VTNGADAADVLIIGAGPAGAATALALQRAGCPRVTIVGRRRPGGPIGEAAAPDVPPLLRQLGLPDRLDVLGHDAHYGIVSAWGGMTPSVNDFVRRGLGHGWRLDRAAFDRWLTETAADRGAAVIDGIVRSLSRSRGRWHATIDAGGEPALVSAPAIVLAGGRSLPAAVRFGLPLLRIDRLVALAVTIRNAKTGGEFDRFSAVEAAEHGWWYQTRTPNGSVTVMLMTDADIARAYRFVDPRELVGAWRKAEVISALIPPPHPGSALVTVHSAGSQYLSRACGVGWFAAGDALMAFDPLSASGIAGALRDGIEVARAIAAPTGCADRLSDEVESGRRYASRANTTLKRFLAERTRIYDSERRWRRAPFWSRRTSEQSTSRSQPTI